MADVHADAANRTLDGRGEPWMSGRIRVAMHGKQRRDRRELVEHLVAAHVAGVEDQLDACKRLVHVGPNEAMGVRNQTDEVTAQLPSRAAGGGRRAARALRSSLPPAPRPPPVLPSPQRGTNACS